MNTPLPLQHPLSSLFDQTDAKSTPNAPSSNSRAYYVRKAHTKAQHKSMVSLYPHFSLESSGGDSHLTVSHSPTTLLEHPASSRGLTASHSVILSDSVNGLLHGHSPQRTPSPTAQLQKHADRPHHTDARSVHPSVVNHKDQYKVHLAQPSRSLLFDESVPTDLSAIRRSLTPTIRVTAVSSTLNDSSDANSFCSDKNFPLHNTIRSSSPVPLSHHHSGSNDCTLSHLALAALATVQLHVGDELARLSSNEQTSLPLLSPSLQRTSPFPSRAPRRNAPFTSPLSPTRALCLDLHFSSGLHAIREGHLLCARSTVSEFNRAIDNMLHSSIGIKNCSYPSFGSCDALLSADKEHRNASNLRVLPASARNTESRNFLPGPPKRTTSMSALLSQWSLASRVLTLPMPSSSSTSSASPRPSCVTRSSAVSIMASTDSPTTPCNSDRLWPLWRLRTPRFKLYWAVLIVSDATVSMPESLKTKTFLVLFKPNRRQLPPSIHICNDVFGSESTVGQSAKRCTVLRSCPSKQCLCTPHSFSPHRCKVLQVNAVVSNTNPTDGLSSSVIILDASIPNQKVYRLAHCSSQHESTPACKFSTCLKRRSLGAVRTAHCNATPGKSQRIEIAQALRRLWPSGWTLHKLLKCGPRTPIRTEFQSNQHGENSDRWRFHCSANHLAWLSLLSLFPNPTVQESPYTKQNSALLSVDNTENFIANADGLTS
ncbi:unnamed protein product [Dicrocoelium dendriticum]|nr:unnamed protein product [Dicrocoelium dendriticum]